MKEDGKTLLGKMQALETYPPYHEAPLLAENSQEYQHAKEYMQSSTGHRKIGTLSQSEWEAISKLLKYFDYSHNARYSNDNLLTLFQHYTLCLLSEKRKLSGMQRENQNLLNLNVTLKQFMF